MAEVAIASFLAIVLGGLSVDLTLLFLAAYINDAACRDAARAAAMVPTSASTLMTDNSSETYAEAKAAAMNAASAQLTVHTTDGHFISQPTLLTDTSHFVYYTGPSNPWPPQQAYTQTTSGNQTTINAQTPYVVCTTQVSVLLPVPIGFFGVALKSSTGTKSQTFMRSYVFPIVTTALGLPSS